MEPSATDPSNTYAPSYSNRDPGMNVPGKTALLSVAICSLSQY
jgi:hypothetical protein